MVQVGGNETDKLNHFASSYPDGSSRNKCLKFVDGRGILRRAFSYAGYDASGTPVIHDLKRKNAPVAQLDRAQDS